MHQFLKRPHAVTHNHREYLFRDGKNPPAFPARETVIEDADFSLSLNVALEHNIGSNGRKIFANVGLARNDSETCATLADIRFSARTDMKSSAQRKFLRQIAGAL